MMRTVSIFAMATIFAPAGALAADYKTTCMRGEDARVIEVLAPGQVGQSCDVRYTRSANNVSVPYHADNSDSFCNEKARALVQRLTSAGFSCASTSPALRAEAQGDAEESDYVVEAQRAAPTEDGTVEQPAQTAAASHDTDSQAVAPRPVVFDPAPASLAPTADEEDGALEEEMNRILAQPSMDAPSYEPSQLIPQTSETPQTGPQPSPVGRLSGADPNAPRAAASPTPASAVISQTETSSPDTEATEPVPAPAAQTPPAEKKPALRTPAEIIRATLMAQAAAWNEGDLEGFMAGYWKSDDLKFVSGVEITQGWSATMKRYRDRYAGGKGLGKLSFDRLEPKLITDDVAVVTGRFNLLKEGVTSSGAFTLVMRRDNGAWRIVHDHTAADPASG